MYLSNKNNPATSVRLHCILNSVFCYKGTITCVCVCVCVCNVMVCNGMYVCVCVCMYVCMYVCVRVYVCVCMCVCMYVCMYVCVEFCITHQLVMSNHFWNCRKRVTKPDQSYVKQ